MVAAQSGDMPMAYATPGPCRTLRAVRNVSLDLSAAATGCRGAQCAITLHATLPAPATCAAFPGPRETVYLISGAWRGGGVQPGGGAGGPGVPGGPCCLLTLGRRDCAPLMRSRVQLRPRHVQGVRRPPGQLGLRRAAGTAGGGPAAPPSPVFQHLTQQRQHPSVCASLHRPALLAAVRPPGEWCLHARQRDRVRLRDPDPHLVGPRWLRPAALPQFQQESGPRSGRTCTTVSAPST